ncbi:tripartite-type tricarboxylate transporter receptor subunit TctC [Variovorax beijingensis]|jgi:tripartite-type tricarboxylate transporter receptor subunit TctC|uniref:Tripartite-type tricarboxylate transporter receptor subunit TctC n=2 Tax=Variovorax TaxID=34072 RepID=A0AAE4BWS7_VARPD|nr:MULTISPECIES: tripartite tricarboxylate transporter substrate binding protein [Variovorax]MBD9664798.1 tripartite tricarboxylate transporter substrate binding protein [Variovorax sp. VRV01]MDP9963735.1 tripartite-type tricarboxylate transporter receptor subunit TctC [Variovorax paradoxus]MDR6426033.1 tripartite-type tricarboxylate transporter receptor subunit TctC [Variovorax paradoxus]TWD77674.1 tripartite-type tricarboxylate transporter receptor subunit TctC [Variovorax beijingensis]
MKNRLARCLAVLSLAAAASASAQTFPAKPIRWLVPYAAGGGSDFLARTVAQTLSAQVGQPVLVDNKPGGNTALAAAETARAPADGYTVLSADNGTLVFNPALYKALSYSPTKDLAPVTLMGKFPMILVVGANSGIATAKDFIARAKAKPGDLSYASAGAGSPHHLAMELLKVEAGLFMVHVPYRGAAPALADVVGGQLPAMMVDLAAGAGFIKGGKVRALAVANPTRLPQLPDVPTFAELGYRNVEAAALVGVVVPSATPPEVVNTLNRQLVAAINEPSVRTRMTDFGVEPVGSTPAQYAALLKSETVRWHKLIRDLKITLD